jgi:hypothetical protein
MATCEGCCHLTGAMLNLVAETAVRAQIGFEPRDTRAFFDMTSQSALD